MPSKALHTSDSAYKCHYLSPGIHRRPASMRSVSRLLVLVLVLLATSCAALPGVGKNAPAHPRALRQLSLRKLASTRIERKAELRSYWKGAYGRSDAQVDSRDAKHPRRPALRVRMPAMRSE